VRSQPPLAELSPRRYPFDVDDGRIDLEAGKVVRRLTRHGYEAYLVGGCVRDLLVGRSPKDFDVATSARPDDVRRLFRNSRIIGRRFRLVHVLFGGGKVIETATFRRAPEQDDQRAGDNLLIRNDNVFGQAHEDARRRDFTINALFYDLEHGEVIDWVDGMPDIQSRTVHTIGDPVVRFQEDPVRVLRAIKFSARLDFGIAPDVYDAMVQCRGALAMAARPRLFEEMLRLLRGGAAHRSVWLAWETGVLDVLLPELAAYLSDASESNDAFWKLLSAVDHRTLETSAPLDDIVLWSALLSEPMREACSDESDRVGAAYEFLEPIVDRLNVPRRVADAVRRIVGALPRLESGRTGRFSSTPLYPLAREMHLLTQRARGAPEPEPLATPRAAARAGSPRHSVRKLPKDRP
jgi:poly(A) polymerase